MPEIKIRPNFTGEETNSEQLYKWKNFLVDVAKRGNRGNDFSLPPEDAGQVAGLASIFQQKLVDMEGEAVLETLERMAAKIEERQDKNMRVAGKSETEAKQELFEDIVSSNLPSVAMKEDNRGRKYVSTYEHGLRALGKKALLKVFSGRRGEKQKNFDDGFYLSAGGITIFNAVGGEQRINERISWADAEGLSFGLVSPPILDALNTPRRNLWGKPEPIIPFGAIRIWERSGQDTDNQVPDKAVVILRQPDRWMDLIYELKDEFGTEATAKEKLRSAAPIDWGTFVRSGMLEYVKVGGKDLMDILIRRTKRLEESAAAAEVVAAVPRARRKRRFW